MVEPAAPGSHIFSLVRLPRLGAVLLATVLRRGGHDATVQAEVVAPLDLPSIRSAQLVGISTITSTAPRSYKLADKLRAAGVPVVLGGPHPTALPDEALGHADWVVRGEGEVALPALVTALEEGGDAASLARVPGLSWRREDGVGVHNPVGPRVTLDALPDPDWRLVRGGDPSGRCAGGTIPMQSSRGCPFACTFCAVTKIFGRTMRHRNVDAVVDAVRPYSRRRDAVFFYDDNFAANRDRTAALCEALLRANIRHLAWSAQVRADVGADPELLALMRRAGARTFYIGLESADLSTLQAMDKRQTVSEMRVHLARIRSCGIRVHGMFVLGLDGDTPSTAAATVQFAIDERLSSAQFLILIPLPGSQVYEQLCREGRVTQSDWSLFDGHNMVVRPRNFSPQALQVAQLDAHARFYSPRRQLRWLARSELKSAAICHYARRIRRAWDDENRAYMTNLGAAASGSH